MTALTSDHCSLDPSKRRSEQLRSHRMATLLLVCSLGLSCCGEPLPSSPTLDALAGEDDQVMLCGFAVTTEDGKTTRHLDDGDEVELLKGYQGYLLVQVRAHLWGAVSREVQLRVSGAKDGGPSFATVVPARTPIAATDGHLRTTPLEIWLTPADPFAFRDQLGTLTLQAKGAGRTCTRTVKVRFVDKTFCVHHDDGSVVCP